MPPLPEKWAGDARNLEEVYQDIAAVAKEIGVRATLLANSQRPQQDLLSMFNLSNRQEEIARLIASGLRDSEIGQELGLSVRTVKNHARSLYRKTGQRQGGSGPNSVARGHNRGSYAFYGMPKALNG